MGALRCPWALEPADYRRYHDEEWGRPQADDAAIFERICFGTFQSGLSCLTILRKREALRAAFRRFEVESVAAFGKADVARLLGDAEIVRNRAKIEACIANARVTLRLWESGGSLAGLIWRFEPAAPRAVPCVVSDLPTVTAESTALSAELRHHGFCFVGPTAVYATMQYLGVVNDHLGYCRIHPVVEAERAAFAAGVGLSILNVQGASPSRATG